MGKISDLLPRQKGDSFWRAFRMTAAAEEAALIPRCELEPQPGHERRSDGTLPPHAVRDGEFAILYDDIHHVEKVVLIIVTEIIPNRFRVARAETNDGRIILSIDGDEQVTPLGSHREITENLFPELTHQLRVEALSMGGSPLPPLVLVRAIWWAHKRGVTDPAGLRDLIVEAKQAEQVIYDQWVATTNRKFEEDGIDYRVGESNAKTHRSEET